MDVPLVPSVVHEWLRILTTRSKNRCVMVPPKYIDWIIMRLESLTALPFPPLQQPGHKWQRKSNLPHPKLNFQLASLLGFMPRPGTCVARPEY